MIDSLKLYVVKCGGCSTKQLWDSSMKHKVCGECSTNVVLKTASPEEIKQVKGIVGKEPLTFSNYYVYSLSPEDVEEAIMIKRVRQKKMKEDVEERKKYAQMEKMNFSMSGNSMLKARKTSRR